MPSLEELLQIFTDIKGVKAALIVGRDGFVIEGSAEDEADIEFLGAIASTGLSSPEAMSKELDLGPLTQAMIEYEGGPMVLSPIGEEAILAIIAEATSNLGRIRYTIRKNKDAIESSI